MARAWDSLFEYKPRIPKVLVLTNKRINQTNWVVLFVFIVSYFSLYISFGFLWEVVNLVTVLTADGDLQAQNSTNLPCATRRASVENVCIDRLEAIVKESARSTFIATYVNQEVASEADPSLTAKTRLTHAAEDASITFYFTGDRRLLAGQGRTRGVHLNSDQVQTEIAGMDRKFEPGTKITLKITDIIRATSGAEEMRVENGGILGPELKKVGGEIGVQVDCEDGTGHFDTYCNLRFFWLSNQAQRQETLAFNGESYLRSYHGLRLTCLEGNAAIHGNVEFRLVLECLSSLIVFLGAVQKGMNFFFLHCLGHLSTIYRRAALDEFSLRQYTADTCAHALLVAAAFADLTAFHSDEAISLKCVCERFRKILEAEGETFSEDEVDRIAAFVQFNVSQRQGAASLKGQKTDYRKKLSSSHITDHITLAQFIEACSSTHGPDFHAMIQLFHKDRHVGVLERFFMPNTLRMFVFGETGDTFSQMVEHVKEEIDAMHSLEHEKSTNHSALKKLKTVNWDTVNFIPSWTPEQYRVIEQRVLESSDEGYTSLDRRLEHLETIINDLLPMPTRPVHDTHVSLRLERSGKREARHDINSCPHVVIEPTGMEHQLQQRMGNGCFDKLEDAGKRLELQIAKLERMAGWASKDV